MTPLRKVINDAMAEYLHILHNFDEQREREHAMRLGPIAYADFEAWLRQRRREIHITQRYLARNHRTQPLTSPPAEAKSTAHSADPSAPPA